MSLQTLKYEGLFSIVVTEEAEMHLVPSSTTVDGRTIQVSEGTAKLSLGGVQFFSKGTPFYFGYDLIIIIYDGEKKVLWNNSSKP